MKSRMVTRMQPDENLAFRHYIVECNCLNALHLLVFEYDPEYKDIAVQFASNSNLSFPRRVLAAIKYVFKKQKYPIGDSVLIDTRNIEDLEAIIADLKSCKPAIIASEAKS